MWARQKWRLCALRAQLILINVVSVQQPHFPFVSKYLYKDFRAAGGILLQWHLIYSCSYCNLVWFGFKWSKCVYVYVWEMHAKEKYQKWARKRLNDIYTFTFDSGVFNILATWHICSFEDMLTFCFTDATFYIHIENVLHIQLIF